MSTPTEPTPPRTLPPLEWPGTVPHQLPPSNQPGQAIWTPSSGPVPASPGFSKGPGSPGSFDPASRVSSGGGRGRRYILIGGCCVVVLALIAWAAVAWTAEHHQAPGPIHAKPTQAVLTTLRTLWSTDATSTSASSSLDGSWLTATDAVDAQGDFLTGYTLATGAPAWTLPAPAGSKFCAMSPTTGDNGIGVVGYGASAGVCDHITGINTSTGRQLWTVSLATTGPDQLPLTTPHIAVAGSAVAAEGPTDTLQVYNLADGTARWSVPPSTSLTDICLLQDTEATAGTIYAMNGCLSGGDQLVGYDATTGTQTYTGNASAIPQLDEVTLWGTGPILAVDVVSQTAYAFTTASPTPAKFSVAGYAQNAFTDDFGQKTSIAQAQYGNTAYIQGPEDNEQASAGLSAVNLTTGRTLWTHSLKSGVTDTIISADSAGVHVLLQNATEQYQVIAYDPATGAASIESNESPSPVFVSPVDTLYLHDGDLIDVAFAAEAGSPAVTALSGVS